MSDLRKRFKNPLIVSFLSTDTHYELVQEVLENPTEFNKKKLDTVFKDYYIRVRLISYMTKIIHFEAKNFDKKIRIEKRNLMTTSVRTYHDDQLTETLIYNLPYYERAFETGVFDNDGIEALLLDEKLYKGFCGLSSKQQNIIYMSYVKNLKDIEIAKNLNVSQQSVSKMKKIALNKLRRFLCVKY
ncbi:sigma factor-like helix-turn-helix DNA-binding protein [Alkalihalophilus marmarensis]|uniref:sigma factor-like helix-turn-helix DNA-binding protein n=1 Tax=Alkalihalophilus marmarensis TaxID=521377 RepID=UPI002DBA6936|nr:sigma factor-like helix-turn-helix DNA-binding protein [Alkalihalophilus marmarensis]MEC2074441.1 sigma factor-like helix-turn-helix DNA-binding protein [Alkalihalophilus marmarensis]